MRDGCITAQERLHTQPGSAKTVADILTAAADLIEPGGRWTQFQWARDINGRPVAVLDDAACWCMAGAIAHVAPVLGDRAAGVDAALRPAIGKSMSGFNDAPERTQAEVVAALRAAAEKARTAAEAGAVGTSASE